MGLFGKNKKSRGALRPLSEGDIQKKLYGEVKPKADQPPPPASPESPRPRSAHPYVTTQEKPHPRHEDLFHLGTEEREQPPKPKPAQPENQEFERMNRLSQLAEEEKKTRGQERKAAYAPDAWQRHQKSTPAFVGPGKTVGNIAKSAGSIGLQALKIIGGVLVFVLSLLFRAVQLIDVRRPEVRRILYWLGGAALLIALFMGIHLLNVRREAAMKTPAAAPASSESAREERTPEPRSAAETPEPAREEPRAPAQRAPERETAQTEESAAAPAEDLEPYVIQVATYANPADAERVVSGLEEGDLPAFVKSLSRPSGRVYYSVFLGRYPNFRQAQLEFEEFREHPASTPFQDAFIRTLD